VFVVYGAGSGLCDDLVTRSEESYLTARDLETSTLWRPRTQLGCRGIEKKTIQAIYSPYNVTLRRVRATVVAVGKQ